MTELAWVLPWVGTVAAAWGLGGVWARRVRRQQMRAWQADLERRVRDLVDARFFVAECEAALGGLLSELPREYVHPVFEAMRLGHRVERAVVERARQMGYLDVDLGPVVVGSTAPPEAPSSGKGPPSGSVSVLEFRDGRLVPRRR